MTLRRGRLPPALLAAIALAAWLLASCSSRIGWGVVLWSSAEGPIPAGSVVPVYIKSNIQSLYVVGAPDGKKKVELPLWQVEIFGSRGAANARAAAFGEYRSIYMVAAKDGIPIRDGPNNGTATQVFRLREGQSVKVLARVEGEAVATGGRTLPGEWYQVLADDGTRGYVFSYAFKTYDETKEGPPVIAASKKSLSGRLELIFTRSWRPEYFQTMLDDGRVDLDLFSLRYGLFVDSTHRQIRLELPGASELFAYSSITESDGIYSFEGTPLKARIESEKRLLLSWVDDAPADVPAPAAQPAPAGDAAPGADLPDAAAQAPQDDASAYKADGAAGRAALIALDVEPREAIRLEELRRQRLLEAFVDAGAEWSSPEAGRLAFSKNRRFTWTSRGELGSGYLQDGLGDFGEVAFRLFLDKSLEGQWDGAFSLRFDPPAQAEPGASRPAWIDFAYRRTPEGLVLAPAVLGRLNLVAAGVDPGLEPLVLHPASR